MTDLEFVFDGWQGYHSSIVSALAPLTVEQFGFRLHPEMMSAGELALHLPDGRGIWFERIQAPGIEPLARELRDRHQRAPRVFNAAELCNWLERTWQMVKATLSQWTVEDLRVTYTHNYQGANLAVSRQWTIWRIMAHDIHHGGQLSELLAAQDIFPHGLTWLGGHLTEPKKIP